MAAQQRTDFGGDIYVAGNIGCVSLNVPPGTITDAAVQSAAGIDALKLDHRFAPVYAQDSSTDATVERRIIHVVKGATGVVRDFRAGSVSIASGGGNAVVDLLKNGVSILTATITLDSSNTAYVPESAPGFSSTALVAGDVLEFKLTSRASTYPKGVFAQVIVDEDAA